jgi:ferredoxin-NADP reductase
MPEAAVKLTITSTRAVAPDVVVIDLAAVDDSPLPAWEPGAHIDVQLGCGLVRQYSLCGHPADAGRWRIAVRRDARSRGGSAWLHDVASPGLVLNASAPRNNFPLIPARRYVFLAGGIGITPFLPMAERAAQNGADVRLAFGGPGHLLAAFEERLRGSGSIDLQLHDAADGPIPLERVLRDVDAGTEVYCCGPAGMIEATRELARRTDAISLHVEQFSAAAASGTGSRTVTVELARSGLEIVVAPDESILDAVLSRDMFVASSCREGTCGSCEVGVLAGEPEHRDSVTDPDDPDRDLSMMICVSRARSERLVLDL